MFKNNSTKFFLGVFSFFLFTSFLYAQSSKKEVFKSGSELAYQKNRKTMSIKKRGLSVDACRRIAYDYLKSEDNKSKAISYLEFISLEEEKLSAADMRALSRAYYHNNDFGLATDLLNQYLETVRGAKLKRSARADIGKYKHAEKLAYNSKNVLLVNLGSNINSRYSEINPYVSYNEDLLVYSSKKRNNYNVYASKKKKNKTLWDKSKLVGNLVNTINDEFVAGMSPDGQTLFVHYNKDSGFEDINKSKRINGLYRELDDIGTKINSTYKEEGACYSKSGDTLFFASDRSGGYGGFDLYYSLKIPGGEWGRPINMGSDINTEADENYPNLDPNSSLIYFASKGHNSIGGYDVFYTSWSFEQNAWEKPINIGYPINNTYDNKTISFTKSPRYAYISSIRKHGKGSFDIYKVIFLDHEPDYLIVTGNVFVKDSLENIPFNKLNKQISISVYKDGDLYGIYAFNKKRNTFILALDPGTYFLELEVDNFKPIKKKFTIKENHYRNKRKKINIYLEAQKS